VNKPLGRAVDISRVSMIRVVTIGIWYNSVMAVWISVSGVGHIIVTPCQAQIGDIDNLKVYCLDI